MLLKGLAQVYALKNRVLRFRVKRARPSKELLEVILLIPLFATLASIHHCYGIIWLAFLVKVALVLVRVRVTIALFIVVITTRETITLLFFLVGPT